MSNRILVFYGSYRSDRMGIRLAQFVVERLRRRGDNVELIDAKAINLPMLDRMYKLLQEALDPLSKVGRNGDRSHGLERGEYHSKLRFNAKFIARAALDP